MKTVLLLGGPAAGQRVEVHGAMKTVFGKVTDTHSVLYRVVPMCSHGEVHWFGVLDGADPLALLIAGYGMNVVPKNEVPADDDDQLEEGVAAEDLVHVPHEETAEEKRHWYGGPQENY